MILNLRKTQLGNPYFRQRNGVIFFKEEFTFLKSFVNTVGYQGMLLDLYAGIEDRVMTKGLSRVFNFDKNQFDSFLPRGIYRKYAINDRNVYIETRDDIYPSETYLIHNAKKYSIDENGYGFPKNPIIYNDGYIRLISDGPLICGIEYFEFESEEVKWRFDLPISKTKMFSILLEGDLILLNYNDLVLYVIDRISGQLINVNDSNIILRDCHISRNILSSLDNICFKEYDFISGQTINKKSLDNYKYLDFYISIWQKDKKELFFVDSMKNRIGVFNYHNLELLELIPMPNEVENLKVLFITKLNVHEDLLLLTLMLEDSSWGVAIYDIQR